MPADGAEADKPRVPKFIADMPAPKVPSKPVAPSSVAPIAAPAAPAAAIARPRNGKAGSEQMVSLYAKQPGFLLLLQNDRSHEMGNRVITLQKRIRLVSHILPEALPLIAFCPDICPLVKRHAVLATVLENLLDSKGIGFHFDEASRNVFPLE